MIRIKKGQNELLVSKESYKLFFRSMGYSIIEDSKGTSKKVPLEQDKTTTKNRVIEDEQEDTVSSEQLKQDYTDKIEEDYGFEKEKKNTKRK